MSTASKVRGINVGKDETRRMEDEARKMELKIELLRKTMDGVDSNRSGHGSAGDSGGRWRSGTAKKPLRSGYVKDVLETKPTRSSLGKQQRSLGESGARSRDAAPEMTPESNDGHASSRGGGDRTTPSEAEPQGTFTSVLMSDDPPAKPGTRAASNLQAALGRQSHEALEVEAFLAGLGLDRYVSLFLEHGFDCMEVVNEMQESHMRDIGMATGHALKLRKRLAELNPAPAPAPSAPAPAAVQSGAPSATQRRVSFGQVEEAKLQPLGGTGTDGASLLSGHFDEEESKASFQEAVRAWREGRSADEGASVTADETEPTQKLATGSFWSSVGGEEVNLQRCSTPISTPAETMTQSETQHDPAPSEEKLCCYQCYKQFFARYAVERSSPLPDQSVRRLCSESCASLWVASMQAKADELLQRQEKLARLEEVKRVMEHEIKAGAEPAVAA